MGSIKSFVFGTRTIFFVSTLSLSFLAIASAFFYNKYVRIVQYCINTCTVLYFSVLYCIKIRKFAHDKEQGTFQKLKSTLRGSWPITNSDSRINKYVRIVQYTIVHYNTLHYAIVSRHLLWLLMLAISHPRKLVSVLYKKRKICLQRTDRQGTFQKLKSTLRGSWPI